MKWMDETSFIAATRYSRKKMVTYSVDKIEFKIPIYAGAFLEITSTVKENTGVKLRVYTKIVMEDMYEDNLRIAAESWFTFVCLNENGLPQRIKYYTGQE